jgi:biotin-(acetyl-CoA carboxylase) ligase
LASLRKVWQQVLDYGPESILARVNTLWNLPRRVQLDLDGHLVAGAFMGVDALGRLQLELDGQTLSFEPQAVRLLRDMR